MSNLTEFVLVGGIVDTLKRLGSWCGETHVQKTSYVAKCVEHVPLESDFVLYKHGPYSFDLNGVLNQMRGQRIITLVPQGGYGASFDVNKGVWSALNKAAGSIYDQYAEKVEFVCSALARKNVAELERVCTAIYVKQNFPELSLSESIMKLSELKPHISRELSAEAFNEANVFTDRLQAA